MKQIKKQKNKTTQEQAAAPPVSFVSQPLSSSVFYSVFLSVSVFLTALLYGNGMQIATVNVAFAQVDVQQEIMKNRIHRLAAGHPIDQMAEIISKEDKQTAAFLVGIAKKESNWGKRVPRAEDGTDCYNYWGYRGAGSRGIAMGHGCFGSPEEAVGIVGGRLDTLINEYQFRTAQDLIVWKCGWSCDGHSDKSVKKWIADVGYYAQKFDKPVRP